MIQNIVSVMLVLTSSDFIFTPLCQPLLYTHVIFTNIVRVMFVLTLNYLIFTIPCQGLLYRHAIFTEYVMCNVCFSFK